MKKAVLAIVAIVLCVSAQDLRKKWNPPYTCTGTDTAYVTVKIMRSGVQTYYARDTVVPPIGSMVCVKYDFQQMANEKIPEVCERIGAKAAAIEGYYPVTDTTKYTDAKGEVVEVVPAKVWQQDEKRKPVVTVKAVEEKDAELEQIEVIP